MYRQYSCRLSNCETNIMNWFSFIVALDVSQKSISGYSHQSKLLLYCLSQTQLSRISRFKKDKNIDEFDIFHQNFKQKCAMALMFLLKRCPTKIEAG